MGNKKAKIQIVRGNKNSLPSLLQGELGYATDSNELYIGDPDDGNVLINTNKNPYDDTNIKSNITDIEEALVEVSSQLETIIQYLNINLEPYFNGRWFSKTLNNIECKCSINCGAEIYANVSNGTYLKIKTADMSVLTQANRPYIAYSIDGGDYTRVQTNGGELNINIPSRGVTKVRIIVDSINLSGDKWNNEEGLAIESITSDGIITSDLSVINNESILFLGDSITEGQSIKGSGNVGLQHHLSYPHLISKSLGLNPLVVGFGGTGLLVGGNCGMQRAELCYSNISNNRLASDNKDRVKLIIINYGTNDVNAQNEAQFKTNFIRYVEKIHNDYPNNKIILVNPCSRVVYPNVMKYLVETYEYIYYIDLNYYPTPSTIPTTDGVHLSELGHTMVKDKLIAYIQQYKLLTNTPLTRPPYLDQSGQYQLEKQQIENNGGYYRNFKYESTQDNSYTLNGEKFVANNYIQVETSSFKNDGVIVNKDFVKNAEIKIYTGKTFCIGLKIKDATNKLILYNDGGGIKFAKLVNGNLTQINDLGAFSSDVSYVLNLIKNDNNININIKSASEELNGNITIPSEFVTNSDNISLIRINSILKYEAIKFTN